MVATCAPGIPLALRHAVFGIERIARRTAGLRAAAMAKGGLHRQAARLAGRSGPRARPADRRHSLVWHKATRSSAVGPQPRPAHPVGQRGDRLGDQRRGVRAHVTGASSGIGAATARLLHKAGAHPVLAARRADRLAVLSEELDGALAVPTDVTDPTAVRRLVETTLDRHGRIDGLVNNAGVSLHSPLDRLDLDEFARVLQLNVISLVAMTQAVLPAMRARGSGRIVNISSGVRRQCRPARATPKRSASPRAAAATGTSAASSSAAALTRSACAAEALPALFAVLIATKLIGAAERASVQDRLRSLPRLRQASATLPTCAPSIPCSVTSGRTAGWVACHRRPWSVHLAL